MAAFANTEYMPVEQYPPDNDPLSPQRNALPMPPGSGGARRQASGHAMRNLGQASPLQVLSDQDFPRFDDVVWEIRTRAELLLQRIPPASQTYLMDLYWEHYNRIFRIVHKESFYQGASNPGSPSYSGFLHVCLLAMGFTFADKSRPDMQRFLASTREGESTLHTEARRLAKYEMDIPGGLSSIQALLILADLESGVGRDVTGWMYVGIAIRSAFELGLNEESSEAMSEQHRFERRMVFCACFLFDRFWAVYLGRSPSIKPSDIGYTELTPISAPGSGSNSQTSAQEVQIYESLVQLVTVYGEISTLLRSNRSSSEPDMLKMADLAKSLRMWRENLPPSLNWTPENCQLATPGFFLLHQQYHMAVILLHQPLAHSDSSRRQRQAEPGVDPALVDDVFPQLSARLCQKHASCIANILEKYYHTPGRMYPCGTALLTASTAGIALVNDLTSTQQNKYESPRALRQVQVLMSVLGSMGHKYRRANQIAKSLGNVLIDRGWNFSGVTNLSGTNSLTLGPMLMSPLEMGQPPQMAPPQTQKLINASNSSSIFDGMTEENTPGIGHSSQDQRSSGSNGFAVDQRSSTDGKGQSILHDLSPSLNAWMMTDSMALDTTVFETATEDFF
ncbi:hypothetical protein Z517_11599 [Fonsecaea pedrosoi CBS 271.37]|uniref:Xylanolytic transcriptional activator regulatory domain-containing protein n=1 Tax=Fonsecaea pedrosoi CBS 271.37 TaxID=1442368 RepID=A0A0D2GQW2_9EURO|nr:uncharacterized protein Z517_11599 [Fonsecaea pedrosoi CBS 271.37]KIW74829.1 hypothetical protein Z517_11599 [Fonsecaea pedrosoi CBS 271.37]